MDVETIGKALEAVKAWSPYRLIVEDGRCDFWLREADWIAAGPVLEVVDDPEGLRFRVAEHVWLWLGASDAPR